MKLYEVKDKNGNYTEFVYNGPFNDVKSYLKHDCSYGNFDLRTLKVKPMPKGRFESSDLNGWYGIFYNGEAIVGWDDNAIRDYPGDLCWSRDISRLIQEVENLKNLEFVDKLSKILDKHEL